MPINFECPHCGFQTEVAERFAGQSGSCANCKKPIAVPGTPIAKKVTRTPANGNWITFAVLGALLMFGGLLFGLLYIFALRSPALGNTPAATIPAERVTCSQNLTRISQAIKKYVDEKGHYPPAYVADESGKPIHSWRVLLLPYLGENDLYAQYDMSKPWDDPVNLRIIGKMPSVYRCPSETVVTDEPTYMLLTGKNCLFEGDKEPTVADVADDPASAVLVFEVRHTGIQWTEPKDLSVDTADWARATKKGLGSRHTNGGLHVLTADGTVHHLGEYVSPEALRAMATVDGNEKVDVATWSE